ncbi:hypothetical protein FQN51_002130 [Onygenales sp. PD_10]|nr:hypothetical protein FQN51_002130 [Onygenales sp. PD_10]
MRLGCTLLKPCLLVPESACAAVDAVLTQADISATTIDVNGDLQDKPLNIDTLWVVQLQAWGAILQVWKDGAFYIDFGKNDEVWEAC